MYKIIMIWQVLLAGPLGGSFAPDALMIASEDNRLVRNEFHSEAECLYHLQLVEHNSVYQNEYITPFCKAHKVSIKE